MTWFDLALALGGRTVDELQAAMSAREFAEWGAYAMIRPWPADRADIRAATIAALIAESNRDRKRRRKPYGVREFLDLFNGAAAGASDGSGDWQPAPVDPDRKSAELWANLKAWALSCGAKKAG